MQECQRTLNHSQTSKHSLRHYCGFTLDTLKDQFEDSAPRDEKANKAKRNTSRSISREQLFEGLYKEARVKEEKEEKLVKKQ